MKYVESQLGSNQFNSLDQLVRASDKNDPLYEAVEILLKGPEISLVEHDQPPYADKDGHLRSQARIRWWIESATTLREIAEIAPSFTTEDGNPYPRLPDIELAEKERSYVYTGTVPVFYGHYWRSGSPQHIRDWTDHCACVDFSAAKGGELTAYRWSGETTIDEDTSCRSPPERDYPSLAAIRSASRRFTGSGSSSDTSPPSIATSLASDDDTNEYRGAVATKKVSTPATCLFICAICSSYSKSVPVRRPLTMAVMPT